MRVKGAGDGFTPSQGSHYFTVVWDGERAVNSPPLFSAMFQTRTALLWLQEKPTKPSSWKVACPYRVVRPKGRCISFATSQDNVTYSFIYFDRLFILVIERIKPKSSFLA